MHSYCIQVYNANIFTKQESTAPSTLPAHIIKFSSTFPYAELQISIGKIRTPTSLRTVFLGNPELLAEKINEIKKKVLMHAFYIVKALKVLNQWLKYTAADINFAFKFCFCMISKNM